MKTLKREEIHANQYRNLEDLLQNVTAFIETYYNRVRLHSALGYQPPEQFEQATSGSNEARGASMSFFRHREIYRSDETDIGTSKGRTVFAASPDHRLDESPAGYSSAVALQQRPLPLRQLQTSLAYYPGIE
jgi:Integrase core domain